MHAELCISTWTAPCTSPLASAQGYAVVDDLFSPALGLDLRQEVLGLYRESLMHKNCTHLVGGYSVGPLVSRAVVFVPHPHMHVHKVVSGNMPGPTMHMMRDHCTHLT